MALPAPSPRTSARSLTSHICTPHAMDSRVETRAHSRGAELADWAGGTGPAAVPQANHPKLIHWVAGGYLEADQAEFAVRLPLCSTGHAHALASSCRFRNLRENRFSGGLSAISVLTLITSLYAPQPLQLLSQPPPLRCVSRAWG